MEQVLPAIQQVIEKLPLYIAALVGVLTALIGFFMLIPGEQPEKALQKVLDVLTKFSRK